MFTGSGATAAGGLGLLAAPAGESAPASNLALFGVGMELAAFERMKRRIGMVAEPYSSGRGGAYVTAATVLSLLGAAGSLFAARSRVAGAASGAALLTASAATRWGIFHAGMASADDPKYTVVPQRQRLPDRQGAENGHSRPRSAAAGPTDAGAS